MKNLRIAAELVVAAALIAGIVWWVFAPRSFIGDSDAVDRCVTKARNLFSSGGQSARAEMHDACRDVFEDEEFRARYDEVATKVPPDSRIREYARAAQEIYCPKLASPLTQCGVNLDEASPLDAQSAWISLRDAVYKMEIGDALSAKLLKGIEDAHRRTFHNSPGAGFPGY